MRIGDQFTGLDKVIAVWSALPAAIQHAIVVLTEAAFELAIANEEQRPRKER